MSETNNTDDRIDLETGSNNETLSDNQSEAIDTRNITTERRGNHRGRVYKKRQGMEKIIIVGTRVSAKCGELISNPRGSQYRRVRERLFGNVVSSVGRNKYSILFDNGITKEIQSNSLRIEDSSAGVPISEAIATAVEVTEMDNNTEENIDHDADEAEEITFPMDGSGADYIFDDTNEEDNGMNDEAEINIGDINIPADKPTPDNNSNSDNNTSVLSYHQKLEHNAELSITVNVYAGILTKQLIRKAASFQQLLGNITFKCKSKEDPDYREEVSDMSKNSVQEPKVKFYPSVTNEKGKTYKKSRRYIVCQKLTVAYCGCCNKAFCYTVGGKKHDRTCLINHIKIMKKEGRRSRKRSYIV